MTRSPFSAAGFCVLLGVAIKSVAAQPTPVTPGFNAGGFLITPDASRVVFARDEGSVNVFYSARTDGVGSPIPVSPLTGGINTLFQAQISPDSQWLLFNRDEHPTERLHVATYASRIDGSAPPTLLNISPIYDDDTSQYNLAISPDSRYAIIRADRGDNSFDLLSRRIDGSSAAMPLNDPLHPEEGAGRAVAYNWSMAGNLVVFEDPNNEQGWGLYSRVFDGSAPAQKLSPSNETFGWHTINDSRVAMITYPGPGEIRNVYSNSTAGGALTFMHSRNSFPYSLRSIDVSPNGIHALMLDSDFQLFALPTDSSATPKLLGRFPDSTSIGYNFSPDSSKVAYFSRQGHHGAVEVLISPGDGSGTPLRLSPPAPAGREVRYGNFFHFTSDSQYLVYSSDQLVADRLDIFSVPVDGSSLPVRLSGPASYVLTPDGKSIVAALNDNLDGYFDRIVMIPITGGEPIELAESPYATGGIPTWGSHWQLSQDGKMLVFLADNNMGTREIFAVAIPEPGFWVSQLCAALLLSLWRRGGRTRARRPCHG